MVKHYSINKPPFCFSKVMLIGGIFALIFNLLFLNPALAQKIEIDNKDVEKIKTGLDLLKTFGNIVISDQKIKNALNITIKTGETGTDITYGLFVLSAMNEMELIDMVVSLRYQTVATAYFNQIIDERTNLISYWKGIGFDLPKVLSGGITGQMSALTLNSFSISNKVLQIFLTVRNIAITKMYGGLWQYFRIRRNNGTHEEAWLCAKDQMGWIPESEIMENLRSLPFARFNPTVQIDNAVNQLEPQFAALWDKWGPYTDENGVTEAAKGQFKEEMGQIVLEALAQQALAEKEPSLLDRLEKIVGDLISKGYGIATDLLNTIKSTFSRMKIFGGAGVGQVLLPASQSEEKLATETKPPADDEVAEEVAEEEAAKAAEVAEEAIDAPSPTPIVEEQKSLAELQEQLDDIAEQIDVLRQQLAKLAEEKGVKLVGKEFSKKKEEEPKEIEELTEEKEKEIEREIKEKTCQPNSININTASKEELEKITEIGPVIAQRIIEDRPFSSLNDLLRVKGIGEKTLQKIIAQGCAYVEGFYASFTSSGGSGGGSSSGSSSRGDEKEISYPEILISEIQIWDATSAAHDFIELYNPNDFDVDISGYKLRKRTSEGSESSIRVLPSGSIIPKKGYYLWASSEDDGYPGTINADTWTKENIAENNSVAILIPDDTVISALAWGSSTNPFVEKNPFPDNPGKNQSLGRVWDEAAGEYKNTGDNSADFEIQNPTPKDKNKSLELEPPPPPPQNLLLNEFFEEWDSEAPKHWVWDYTRDRIGQDDKEPLIGQFNVWLKPIASHNVLSQTIEGVSNSTYYGEIWAKGTNGAKVRVGIRRDGHNAYGQYVILENNEWKKITWSRQSLNGEDDGMLISIIESESGERPPVYIGAAWLGTSPPPDYWPQGLPPNSVENFQIASSTYNIVTLTWSATTDPDTLSENLSYKIYYSREGALTEDNLTATSIFSTTTTSTTITLSDLYYNSTYYFGIKAFDPENNYSQLSTTSDSLQIPSAWDNSPWPMFQHDPQRTRRSPFCLENPTSSQISILLPGERNDYFHLSAIDPNGILYLRAKIDGREGIFAFYPDGKEKWFYPTTYYPTLPSLGKDGSIYFYSPRGPIALIPAGTLKWSNDSILHHYPDLNPVLGDKNFYQVSICTTPNTSSTDCLVAFNLENGEIDWFYAIDEDRTYFKSEINFSVTSSAGSCSGNCGVTSPTLGPDGTIYFGRKNILYAIGSDGVKKWQREFGLEGDYLITPSLDQEGTLYLPVMSSSSTIWGLYAIESEDSTSTIKWQWQCPGCNFRFPDDFGAGWATPIFGGDVIYQVIQLGGNKYLKAIDSQSGTAKEWSEKGTPMLSDNQGNVYLKFESQIKAIKVRNEIVDLIWEVSPGIAGIGGIFVLDQQGNLYLSGQNLSVIKSQPLSIE